MPPSNNFSLCYAVHFKSCNDSLPQFLFIRLGGPILRLSNRTVRSNNLLHWLILYTGTRRNENLKVPRSVPQSFAPQSAGCAHCSFMSVQEASATAGELAAWAVLTPTEVKEVLDDTPSPKISHTSSLMGEFFTSHSPKAPPLAVAAPATNSAVRYARPSATSLV